MHKKVLRPAYKAVVGGGIYVSSDLRNRIPQTRTVRKRRCLTRQLHCSLALFIHLYLSTSSGVAYSSMHHDGLVMFRMRQHYPSHPVQSTSTHPSAPHRVPEREQAPALPHPVNTLHRIGISQPSPPSSLSTAPNRPFSLQPPEHVDDLAPV